MARLKPRPLDLAALRALVGTAVWARGEDYAKNGLVTLTAVAAERVVARVEGSETYRCVLAGEDLLDRMDCSCPAFEEFAGPCKHLVATALTLAARREGDGPLPADRLRTYLAGLPGERLVELLVELAEADPDLEARLLLQAETATAPPAKLARVLERALADALRTGDYIGYREMDAWAGRVDGVIDRLADAVAAGQPQAAGVLALVPQLIAGLEAAVEHCDDDGHIALLLERAVDLLAGAAEAACPAPQALARLVVALDLDSGYAEVGPPAGALAAALGDEGCAAYWSLLEAEWAGLGELRPRERDERRRDDDVDGRRARLRDRLLARARANEDADAEIGILRRTLATAHDYLQLAEACRRNGRVAEAAARVDEALWFFGATDAYLPRAAAPFLAAAGQAERTLGLLWQQLTDHPSLQAWQDLERIAAPLGAAGAWRERVCEWLERQRASEPAEAAQPPPFGGSAAQQAAEVLVELHLAVGDLDRAWRVAGTSRLSPRTSRALAEASETARPAASIEIYQQSAERAVARVDKQAYREAVALVARIRRLAAAADNGAAVESWLQDLRRRHKAKRSFIAMLDAAAG